MFAAHMQVELLNDGPVTFVLDSRGAKLVPVYAHVCFVKTDRRIIGPKSVL